MKYIVLALFALLSTTGINAQVFIGFGFSNTQLSERAYDDAAGFSMMLEKYFNLSKSTRWKMHPNVHVSFLYSDADRVFQPLYLNIISLSPKVSFEAISIKKMNKRMKIAPYANPFLSMLMGLQPGDPAFESSPIDKFKGGFECGVRADVVLGKTTIRLIPIAVQFGKSSYRQGMSSLLFRL